MTNTDCVFCRIVSGEIPSERIKETPDYVVIRDIAPKAPIHLLIVTKKHIAALPEARPTDQGLLGAMLLETKALAAQFQLTSRGYKVVINNGREGGQVVPHLHFHFLGGQELHMGI